MEIKYRKKTMDYGEYQVNRVIWITALNGEMYVKLNLLDKAGNVLYRVLGSLEETISGHITYEGISQEQIADIQGILDRNDPYNDWYDEDDRLNYFGLRLALIQALKRDSMKEKQVTVEYVLFSSTKDIENIQDLKSYDKGEITQAQIEQAMVLKLAAHKEMDAINIKYYEDGEVTSYRLTLNQRNTNCDNESG